MTLRCCVVPKPEHYGITNDVASTSVNILSLANAIMEEVKKGADGPILNLFLWSTARSNPPWQLPSERLRSLFGGNLTLSCYRSISSMPSDLRENMLVERNKAVAEMGWSVPRATVVFGDGRRLYDVDFDRIDCFLASPNNDNGYYVVLLVHPNECAGSVRFFSPQEKCWNGDGCPPFMALRGGLDFIKALKDQGEKERAEKLKELVISLTREGLLAEITRLMPSIRQDIKGRKRLLMSLITMILLHAGLVASAVYLLGEKKVPFWLFQTDITNLKILYDLYGDAVAILVSTNDYLTVLLNLPLAYSEAQQRHPALCSFISRVARMIGASVNCGGIQTLPSVEEVLKKVGGEAGVFWYQNQHLFHSVGWELSRILLRKN